MTLHRRTGTAVPRPTTLCLRWHRRRVQSSYLAQSARLRISFLAKEIGEVYIRSYSVTAVTTQGKSTAEKARRVRKELLVCSSGPNKTRSAELTITRRLVVTSRHVVGIGNECRLAERYLGRTGKCSSLHLVCHGWLLSFAP